MKGPDTSIYATLGEPETLDPAWCYDTASAEAIFNIYDTLIFFWHDPNKVTQKTMDPEELLAPTDKFIPVLASEVPTVENGLISSDGLTYTFPIRKGVKFQNGEPLTPEDVEYSFKRAMVQDRDGGPVWMFLEPLLGVYSTRDGEGNIVVPFEKIDKAVEVDGDNVIFHLKMPYPPFLQILCQSWSSIVCKKWCIEHGDWPGTAETYPKYNNPEVPPLQEIAMGTGPFKLERWEHGVEYSLVRNDDYWREPAKIKRVIVKKIDEWSTRKLMFQAGDIDICYVPRLYMKEVENVPGIINVKNLPELAVSALFFTFEMDPTSPHIWSGKLDGDGIPPDFFKDRDVRLGFAYSFELETFIRDAWAGEAVQRPTPIIEGLPYFNPDQKGYYLDLKKAEEHFKKAWNGELWDKGFKMTLLYNIGNEYRRISAEIWKRNIESLNEKFFIYIRGVEWPLFLKDMVASKLPAFRVGWIADYPDPHNFVHPFMHSEGAFAAWQHYKNPHVDELIEEGIKTIDPDKRREIYYELQRIYVEDCPSVITVQPLGRRWFRDWIQGWYHNPIYPGFYFYDLWKGY
ncbi:ABC transporter substrate-binding protein [Candidatus Bathyarchaeota archaeon]|nr:MAG: ABC transporter substrate-binding protein [Candidatus Bathyarchaeota archaeon]